VACSVTDFNIFSAELSAGSHLLTQTEPGLNGRSWFIMWSVYLHSSLLLGTEAKMPSSVLTVDLIAGHVMFLYKHIPKPFSFLFF